jgi:hypothetical protein
MAQTGGADVVLVHFSNDTGKARAIISRAASTTEERQVKAGITEQTAFCQQAIAKLYQEGYTLKSTFSVGTSSTNTLVFTKEK